MRRIAYLSCELKSRDLGSRLLIASHLVKAGVPVVVGQYWALKANVQTRQCFPGCILYATANQVQAASMKKAREAGSLVVVTDEEAAPLVDSLPNVSVDALKHCHLFLVDTKAHRDLLANRFGGEKLIVTGSPRWEALKFAKIESMAGAPYVIFNTGFGVINSVWGDARKALEMMSRGAHLSLKEAQDRVDSEQAALDVMAPLIRWLSSQIRVVIRPHPSENAQTWRDAFPNVEVVEGSSPLPWIKSAKVMIHSNSTTGLEAIALRTPALNLDPLPLWGERFTLRRVNHTVETAAEAQTVLSAYLGNQRGGALAHKRELNAYFPTDGAKNIAQSILDLLGDAPPISGKFRWTSFDRDDHQRAKFTATLADVTQGAPGSVTSLDDSVFLISP